MTSQRFATGKQIKWQNRVFEIKRLLPNHQVSLENVTSGVPVIANISDLVNDLFSGLLSFIEEGKHVRKNAGGGIPQPRYVDMSDYPPKLADIARFRHAIVQSIDSIKNRTRQMVRDQIAQIKQAEIWKGFTVANYNLSEPSVYRWMKDFKTSGCDIRALVPNFEDRGGTGVHRISAEVDSMVDAVIEEKCYVREKRTIDDLLHEIAVRVDEENQTRSANEKLRCPNRSTIVRRVEELDLKDVFAAKHGKRAADKEFTQYSQGVKAISPLERAEIDHTPADIIVIDETDNLPLGRPTMTDCLDTATRFPLGMSIGFEPPSYYAVMECLYHAISPKGNVREIYGTMHDWPTYGVMSTLVTDNGKEFIGNSLSDGCLALNIVHEQTPVRHPHFKGGIERYLRTKTTVLHSLPGTTFSNNAARGDYDSIGQACITLSELKQIIHIFLLDIYAERKHKGIQAVPARQWERAIQNGFLPRVPASSDDLAILLGQTTTRKIQPYGIEFESITYNCKDSELSYLRNALKGEDAKIKFHPGNISCIYIYNPFSKDYIKVPAADPDGYTVGLSLWKHRIIKRYQAETGDKTDLVALGQAKRHIQDIVDAARSRKRIGTRKRIARWDTSGEPPSLAGKSSLATTSLDTSTTSLPSTTQEASETQQLTPEPLPPLTDEILTPKQIKNDDEWSIIYQDQPTPKSDPN